MTLYDDVAANLPDLRRQAESMLTLTLAAFSPGGTTKDDDGFDVFAHTPEGFTFGKVQGGAQAGKDTATRYVRLGGVDRPVVTAGLHISLDAKVPVASEQRGTGWEYEITDLGPLDDPALLGRRCLVVAVPSKSFATLRRLDVVWLEGV